jgi:hypothetical protein
MDWFYIYAQESQESWRTLKKRIVNHPLLTLWFFLLSFGFIWLVLRIYVFSIEQDTGGLFADLEVNSILLLIFIIFFAKSVSDTSRKIAQNKALVFHLSQPTKQANVLFGKLFFEMMINLGLYITMLSLFVFSILVFDYGIAGDLWFVLNSVSLVLLGTIIGTMFSLFNVFAIKKRFLLLMWLSPLLIILYYVLYYTSIGSYNLLLILFVLLAFSLIMIIPTNWFFLESWNRGTNPGKSIDKTVLSSRGITENRLFKILLSAKERALLKREIAERLRSKEFIGTVITIIAISYGSLYIAMEYNQEIFVENRFGSLFTPLMVGLGIFAACLLEPGLSQLSSIGKEGKNLWVLKSQPLSGATIIKIKALANMISLPLIIIGPAVFVTLYTGYDLLIGLFAALGALMMVMLFTGIGAWFGARYPNFDESVKGYPDIMTTYIFAMVCFIFCIVFSIIPFGMVLTDRILGILTMIFCVDLAAMVLYSGIVLGGAEIDKLEVI